MADKPSVTIAAKKHVRCSGWEPGLSSHQWHARLPKILSKLVVDRVP